MRILYSVTAVILLFDQLSKFLAVCFLKPINSVPIFPHIFHLSFVENSGIAFGLFQGHPEFWMLIITLSVFCLGVISFFFRKQSFLHRLAFGFILGGATGNWIDRLRFDHVIDFLDFRIWPVFNIADSFITIGVFLFVWLALKGE